MEMGYLLIILKSKPEGQAVAFRRTVQVHKRARARSTDPRRFFYAVKLAQRLTILFLGLIDQLLPSQKRHLYFLNFIKTLPMDLSHCSTRSTPMLAPIVSSPRSSLGPISEMNSSKLSDSELLPFLLSSGSSRSRCKSVATVGGTSSTTLTFVPSS